MPSSVSPLTAFAEISAITVTTFTAAGVAARLIMGSGGKALPAVHVARENTESVEPYRPTGRERDLIGAQRARIAAQTPPPVASAPGMTDVDAFNAWFCASFDIPHTPVDTEVILFGVWIASYQNFCQTYGYPMLPTQAVITAEIAAYAQSYGCAVDAHTGDFIGGSLK